MAGESDLIKELRGMLGAMTAPGINEVERGSIRRYCDAVGNPNPIFTDVEFARSRGHSDVLCPPGFFGWPRGVQSETVEVMGPVFAAVLNAGLLRILDAGDEYEFFLPIHAGDTLSWYIRFHDVNEREGKSGNMVFLTFENTYLNMNGDVVAKSRKTFLARQ